MKYPVLILFMSAAIASAQTSSGPSKATASEVDTGTNNSKYITPKALKDSENIPHVAPGTSGNIMRSNGTSWTSSAAAPGEGDALVANPLTQFSGILPTNTEFNFVDGVTSAIQTQLNAKQATLTLGTGVQTALAVNIGSAGAPVLFNGAGGTPSSLTGTNISGTASSLTAGNATLAATVTVIDSTDATSFPAMFDSATGSLAIKTDGALTYNASTGALAATTLGGAGGAITLDASGFNGNLTTSDNTLQEVAQVLDDLSVGAGVSDGDKGNIVVSSSGTVWTLEEATNALLLSPNNALGAFAIDVTKKSNTKSISADQTFTFSGTPSTGFSFGLVLTNTDSAVHTITIPSSFSLATQAAVTTFTIPASSKVELSWRYDGTTYFLVGEPHTINDLSGVTVATGDKLALYDVSAGIDGNATVASVLALGIDDTAFASSWDTVTTIAPTKNAVYDWGHILDSDDDGKVNVLDVGAGIVKTDSGGIVSAASAGTDYFAPGGTFTFPVAAGSASLSTSGAASYNTSNKVLGIYNGTKEVGISTIYHQTWSFDPKAVCDGAVDRLFLMSTGVSEPFGIHVVGWKVSFEADPTTEVDLDLKRADAFIGVANSAVMDVLDTTAGAASESTSSNINSDAVVANGKVLYLEFGTTYTETTHQIIFEMWWEVEED